MTSFLCKASLLTWLGIALCSQAADPAPVAPPRAFLGVHVVSVPEEVRAQTSLEEDAGLMVDFIMEHTPAEAAGIKRFDILTNIADQKLLSSAQFNSLIKSCKVGETITLGILRQGKPISLQATLVEAPPQEMNPLAIASGGNDLLSATDEERKLLNKLLNQAGKAPMGEGKITRSNAANLSMVDKDGSSVEIIRKDGKQTACVKDASNNIIFEGPLNTPAEREALKPEVRERIERLEKSAHAVGHNRGQ